MSSTLTPRRNYHTDALSPEQQKFVKDLLGQIGDVQPGRMRELQAQLNSEYVARALTGQRASKWIDILKAIRDELRAHQRAQEATLLQMEQQDVPAPRVAEPRPQVPAGRYAVDTEEGHTGFYRVAVNEAGHYQVYVYAGPQQHKIPGWTAQRTILRKIEAAGFDEAGIRFGQERGECDKCGIQLTDEESRKAGRGPICGGRRPR